MSWIEIDDLFMRAVATGICLSICMYGIASIVETTIDNYRWLKSKFHRKKDKKPGGSEEAE